MVVKKGLAYVWELDLRAIIFEGDARVICDSFEQSGEDLSHIGIILVETYE